MIEEIISMMQDPELIELDEGHRAVDFITPTDASELTEDDFLALDDTVSDIVESGPHAIASYAGALAGAGTNNLTLALQIIKMYQELVEWIQEALESFIVAALYEEDPQIDQEELNEFLKSESLFSISSVYAILSSLDEDTFQNFYNSISDDELDKHIGEKFIRSSPDFIADLFSPY